jgi:ectoine hydroxylase-related dioxygenase (phytanoyl-CoA dioxygenase family)
MSNAILNNSQVQSFEKDGVVLIKGVFKDWVETLRSGIDSNMQSPGPYGKNYTKEGAGGQFFGDYCNWQRIGEYRDFLFNSPAAQVCAELVQSETVKIFHEHVLVKEPGTTQKTPWHHDQPYYCVEGSQLCSLWIPLDHVAKSVCPEFIAGSHKWGKLFLPTKFSGIQYEREGEQLSVMPDIDSTRDEYNVVSWDLEQGDCIAFHYLTVHGAPENLSGQRRRAFSARLMGDDAVYAERGGEISPPFPGLEKRLKAGMSMEGEEFPVVHG